MKLHDALSSRVEVNSFTRERAEPVPPAPIPDSGAAWGRSSGFGFAGEPAPIGPNVSSPAQERPARQFQRIIRAEAVVVMDHKRVGVEDEPGFYVEVVRHQRLRFAFTEYPAKPVRSSPQPAVRTEYDLQFALHPEGER